MKSSIIKSLCAFTALLNIGTTAHTQEFSFAKYGGKMHGEATVCGDYTESELKELKRKQKEQFVGMGMKPAQFDAEFEQGYKQGRADLEKAKPEARAKHCEQLRKMAKMK